MFNKNTLEIQKVPEINEILEHPEFLKLDNYSCHGNMSRRLHCIRVAEMSYLLARKRGLDAVSAARGGLLHDFFFYDWRVDGPGMHGFRHPMIALAEAKKHFKLNDVESDIIRRHMWPLTPVPPKYSESSIVCFADKAVALSDFTRSMRIYYMIYSKKKMKAFQHRFRSMYSGKIRYYEDAD